MKTKNHIFTLALSFVLGTFFSLTHEHYTSKSYLFERTTGGHYLGEVEPEIRGVHAHKLKTTPTDNYYNTQKSYSMSNIGDIESVWDNYTGAGTTVAVIDDGFNYSHPEYKRANGTSAISNDSAYFYESNYSYGVKYFKDDNSVIDEEWEEDDQYSEWATHGSNTSTTAAAPMGNGGIVGIAPEATILALKIDMSFVAIKAAIQYAVNKGADVINMSLGAYAESFTDGCGDNQQGSSSTATYLNSVCNTAYNAGVILVAAAGNEATYHKSYPACNNHVIGVGALHKNSNTTLAYFTNYVNSNQTGEVNVDILAPGHVYAAGISGTTSASYNQVWEGTQGTSFSSPIVAGAACLWKQKNPDGTPDLFEQQLKESAAGIGSYVNSTIKSSAYGGTDQHPTGLTGGRLDVGALMSIDSSVTGVTISKSSLNLSYGGGTTSSTISASVTPSYATNKTIKWSTSNANVVSVSKATATSGENIALTATGVGNATITATDDSGAFSKTCSVTVSNWVPIESITLLDEQGQSSSTMERGSKKNLICTVAPNNASNQEYILVSSNENIATITDAGLLTAKGVGNATITAMIENGNDYLEAEYSVTVTKPESGGEVFIDVYDASTLNDTSSATGISKTTFNNKIKVDGTIDNTILSSVSQTRAYTRKGGISLSTSNNDGDFTLTFSEEYKMCSADIVGALWDGSGSLKVNGESAESGSFNSAGSTLAECTQTLHYEFDDSNVVTFTASKRVVIYTISFEYSVDSNIPVKSVSLDKTSTTLDANVNAENHSETLVATVSPNSAANKNVSWSSSNSNVASVNNSGLVTAVAAGSCVITVTTEDGGKTATCNVTVVDTTPIPVTGVSLDKHELNLKTGGASETLTVTYTPNNANQLTTTWTSSDSSVASITGSGSSVTINPLKKGQTTITATCNGHSDTCTVNVDDIYVTSITLNKTSVNLAEEDTTTITATVAPNNATTKTLLWSTSNENVVFLSATSGNTITLTAADDAGGKSATITVRSTDGSDVSASCVVNVNARRRLVSLAFSNLPETVPYKGELDLSSTMVVATFSDDTNTDVTAYATIDSSQVDTSSLGRKPITASYTFEGVTRNVTEYIKVTNNGASANVGYTIPGESTLSEERNATFTFTNSSGAANNAIAGVSWTANGTGFESTNSARGIQWSKTAGTISSFGITSSYKISSIVVTASANAAGATISASVGGNSFGTSGQTVASSTNATYTFTGTGSGQIIISTTAGSKSVYIKSIAITYRVGEVTPDTVFPATPIDQARAWANYFLTFMGEYCDVSGKNSNVTSIALVWGDLASEYGYMTSDSKNEFVTSEDEIIVRARSLYELVYRKYHASLNENNFVTDGNGNESVSLSLSVHSTNNADNPLIIMIIILSSTCLLSYVLYVFIKRKRINSR